MKKKRKEKSKEKENENKQKRRSLQVLREVRMEEKRKLGWRGVEGERQKGR